MRPVLARDHANICTVRLRNRHGSKLSVWSLLLGEEKTSAEGPTGIDRKSCRTVISAALIMGAIFPPWPCEARPGRPHRCCMRNPFGRWVCSHVDPQALVEP